MDVQLISIILKRLADNLSYDEGMDLYVSDMDLLYSMESSDYAALKEAINELDTARQLSIMSKTCACCGIEVTGLEQHKVYCSAACKQRAYRQRKKTVTER